MKATVLEISELRQGKNYPAGYYVVKFAMKDGSFAMSYVGQDYRNWFKWGPLLVDNTYSGCRMLKTEGGPPLIDADSPVVLEKDALPCKIVSKKKPKAQLDLL